VWKEKEKCNACRLRVAKRAFYAKRNAEKKAARKAVKKALEADAAAEKAVQRHLKRKARKKSKKMAQAATEAAKNAIKFAEAATKAAADIDEESFPSEDDVTRTRKIPRAADDVVRSIMEAVIVDQEATLPDTSKLYADSGDSEVGPRGTQAYRTGHNEPVFSGHTWSHEMRWRPLRGKVVSSDDEGPGEVVFSGHTNADADFEHRNYNPEPVREPPRRSMRLLQQSCAPAAPPLVVD
jgi:hypothetical protein